jgi:Uma2 family endonuclease
MAADPALRIPTFEELWEEIERLPEHLTGEILEPGVIRTMSRPGRPHSIAYSQCYRSLGGVDRHSGGSGWWIEQEPAIRLREERLVIPDLAGWRVERCPEFPADNPITLLPDWCCEVLSPSSIRDDRGLKLPLYARCGIPWIWLIDPAAYLVEVYDTDRGHPRLIATAKEDETVRLPPFDLEISLARWWFRPSA